MLLAFRLRINIISNVYVDMHRSDVPGSEDLPVTGGFVRLIAYRWIPFSYLCNLVAPELMGFMGLYRNVYTRAVTMQCYVFYLLVYSSS